MKPQFIDTHTHVNFSAFRNDGPEVIKRAFDLDVWLINVGSQFSTSKRAINIAGNYEEGVYAAVGLHPIHILERNYDSEELSEKINFKSIAEEFSFENYFELVKNKKVVTIGEIGLDYFHIKDLPKETIKTEKEKQKEIFLRQIELAAKIKKPIMIHCRNSSRESYDAYKDLTIILQKAKKEFPEKILDLGFYLSFNGVITFAHDWDKIIENAPLDKILLETDAPYLTPIPYRNKRNEPVFVIEVAKRIAEIKNITLEETARITTENARKLFNL